jgi:hypothetical protein
MLHLFRSVFGISEKKASKYDEEVIDWATEKLVDGTDSRLRLVSGYKRKLRDCVERSVTFVDETVENLPPPLAIDPRAFTTDGQIRAWFGTIQTLREAFSLSLPVRQFISEVGNASLAQFFAGMRTSISEKTVLVPQLRGVVIQREVPRTAFSFIDHMVVAPAASEEALRLELKERAYMNLVERSLRHLVSIKRHKGELEKQRTLLRSKLRTLESTQLGMQPFAAAKPTEPGDVASLEAKLDEIEAELGQTAASIETLDQYLSRVIEVMSKPEDQLRITPAAVRVTQMGFVVPDESPEKCDEVEYTNVEARGLGVFAIRLVTFPVKALQPLEQFRPRI